MNGKTGALTLLLAALVSKCAFAAEPERYHNTEARGGLSTGFISAQMTPKPIVAQLQRQIAGLEAQLRIMRRDRDEWKAKYDTAVEMLLGMARDREEDARTQQALRMMIGPKRRRFPTLEIWNILGDAGDVLVPDPKAALRDERWTARFRDTKKGGIETYFVPPPISTGNNTVTFDSVAGNTQDRDGRTEDDFVTAVDKLTKPAPAENGNNNRSKADVFQTPPFKTPADVAELERENSYLFLRSSDCRSTNFEQVSRDLVVWSKLPDPKAFDTLPEEDKQESYHQLWHGWKTSINQRFSWHREDGAKLLEHLDEKLKDLRPGTNPGFDLNPNTGKNKTVPNTPVPLLLDPGPFPMRWDSGTNLPRYGPGPRSFGAWLGPLHYEYRSRIYLFGSWDAGKGRRGEIPLPLFPVKERFHLPEGNEHP